jgi:hypothetical protein
MFEIAFGPSINTACSDFDQMLVARKVGQRTHWAPDVDFSLYLKQTCYLQTGKCRPMIPLKTGQNID